MLQTTPYRTAPEVIAYLLTFGVHANADDVYRLLDHVFAGAAINELAGDVDGSGDINVLDARLLMNHVADRVGYGLNCTCGRL